MSLSYELTAIKAYKQNVCLFYFLLTKAQKCEANNQYLYIDYWPIVYRCRRRYTLWTTINNLRKL